LRDGKNAAVALPHAEFEPPTSTLARCRKGSEVARFAVIPVQSRAGWSATVGDRWGTGDSDRELAGGSQAGAEPDKTSFDE